MKRKTESKTGMSRAERLEMELCRVLERPLLPYEKVIRACGRLSDELLRGDYTEWIQKAGLGGPVLSEQPASRTVSAGQILDSQMVSGLITGGPIGQEELRLAACQISREVLSERVKRELGEDAAGERRRFPLGVLLHLGAGNAAGLGAYSVIEGLLAGNINLLKPSSADRGISAFLLKELVRLEPDLRPYIHVFSISSDRQKTIERLAVMSDGVVVWGSDETVRKVRAMVGPDKKLIEWGHRFSFVYCSEKGMEDRAAIEELALHIVRTQQRFCSSCQAVFLDTEREEKAQELAEMIREEIDRMEEKLGWDMGQTAQATLREHTLVLEDALAGIYSGQVHRAGGCPVCCLPRKGLVWALRKRPVSLQTAGLICEEGEWAELSYLLLKAGAVRVKRPGQMGEHGMSEPSAGEAHDGEYPLARYTKVVERS